MNGLGIYILPKFSEFSKNDAENQSNKFSKILFMISAIGW